MKKKSDLIGTVWEREDDPSIYFEVIKTNMGEVQTQYYMKSNNKKFGWGAHEALTFYRRIKSGQYKFMHRAH